MSDNRGPATGTASYKATDYYAPEHERCIVWNDPVPDIDWPWEGNPVVSEEAECFDFRETGYGRINR